MSSKAPRRTRVSEEAQVRSDAQRQRQLLILAWVIAGLALAVLIGVVVSNYISSADADTQLNFQLGGLPHVKDDVPRNFRLWTFYPDGSLRFETAFFPQL